MVNVKPRGFTTLEMLVVVGVLLILVGIGVPSLSGMVVMQQLKNAAFDLSSTLSLARSEALTRNAAVTIDPLEGNWARGWTVTDEGGRVIRRQSAYGRVALSGPARVIYSADGRPDSVLTPFAVTATEAATGDYRCVRLRVNGRFTVTRGAC
jgi:type IV fimbrial biogenesis protein FimT